MPASQVTEITDAKRFYDVGDYMMAHSILNGVNPDNITAPTTRDRYETLERQVSQLGIDSEYEIARKAIGEDDSERAIKAVKRIEYFAQTHGIDVPDDFPNVKAGVYAMAMEIDITDAATAAERRDFSFVQYCLAMVEVHLTQGAVDKPSDIPGLVAKVKKLYPLEPIRGKSLI